MGTYKAVNLLAHRTQLIKKEQLKLSHIYTLNNNNSTVKLVPHRLTHQTQNITASATQTYSSDTGH